jgi:hypothetical protein
MNDTATAAVANPKLILRGAGLWQPSSIAASARWQMQPAIE